MPFVTVKGSFHLCGQSAAGNPTGFQPDGDSMQFKPDKPKLLDRLERTADAYRLTSIRSFHPVLYLLDKAGNRIVKFHGTLVVAGRYHIRIVFPHAGTWRYAISDPVLGSWRYHGFHVSA